MSGHSSLQLDILRYFNTNHVEADKCIIYDMGGIGQKVGIRWYFPKMQFSFGDVLKKPMDMEENYRKIREMTCLD